MQTAGRHVLTEIETGYAALLKWGHRSDRGFQTIEKRSRSCSVVSEIPRSQGFVLSPGASATLPGQAAPG